MRFESSKIYGYEEKNLGRSLILCPFIKIFPVDVLLGPMIFYPWILTRHELHLMLWSLYSIRKRMSIFILLMILFLPDIIACPGSYFYKSQNLQVVDNFSPHLQYSISDITKESH